VRRARVRVVLVAGADAHPDAKRHRAHRGQGFGNDPEPAGKDGAADTMGSFGVHLLVMPAGAMPRPAVPVVPVAIAAPLAAVPVTAVPVAIAAVPVAVVPWRPVTA
jgi:hypothetical protein